MSKFAEMREQKKALFYTLLSLAILAVIVAIVFIVRYANKKKVDVYPVERIREHAWGDQFGSYGYIKAGNSQNVYLNADLLVNEVHVSEGQTVSAGDILLSYDQTIQSISVELIELDMQITKNKITKAERELAGFKKLKPSAAPSPPPFVNLADSITTGSKPVGGSGTATDPFIFNCAYQTTTVEKEYLDYLIKEGKYAKFLLYYENFVLMYDWTTKALSADTQTDTWDLSAGITVDKDGAISAAGIDEKYATFHQIATTTDYVGGPHYSQDEINRMITEKENEIESLKLDLKQLDLDYNAALKEQKEGRVYANIDGIVTSVEDPDNIESGQPIISIQSGKGYSVSGTVSELNLDNISVGQEVYVSSWNIEGQFSAVISEIMQFPTPQGNSMGSENPNNSYYEFTALIDTDTVLNVGDWVDITFEEGNTDWQESSKLYLPMAFVRQEHGKNYVMRDNGSGRLEKVYVMTGKNLYGYAVEIKSGVGLEDKIAFPYGKYAVEGAPTVEAEGHYY